MGKDQGIYIYAHDLAVLSRRLEALKFESVDCCNSCINRGGGNPFNGLYGYVRKGYLFQASGI